MASKVFKATLGASLGNGNYGVVPAAGDALVADTTVVANVATLVADGATPTQAHVTTLNTNLGLFKAPLEAAVAADLSIVINSATVTTKNQLRALLRGLVKLVETQLAD